MAHLQLYLKKDGDIVKELIFHKQLVDQFRLKENKIAIKTQSWFRSLQVQKWMRHLHHCALLIQRTYRAYVGRRIYREKVQTQMKSQREAYYDLMATKIQARWRGFYVRKYKADYYARNEYLKGLLITNEIVREQLKQIKEENEEKLERERLEKELKSEIYKNRKYHYLLSTKVSPSVYNSPTNPDPLQEDCLRRVKPLSKTERDELRKLKEEQFLQTATGIPKDVSNDIPKEVTSSPLPPITKKKLQGPFRKSLDVDKQRYKKLEPTLRVATEYTSVDTARSLLKQEEWSKRIIEKSFLPSTKRTESYIPALHSSSKYGKLKYGSMHFRDTSAEKEIHSKEFQRVVSPIPFFDQLGKTY